MQERVKWWVISPHQACKQGVFGVTTKHARRGEMVGHFTSPSMHSMQAKSVWGDIQACKKG
jgi:hypothetical protein